MDGPLGVALFDPDERLRSANPTFLEALATRLEPVPTWEQIMRDCHRHRRGLAIETDDMDAWIARVRTSHRQRADRSFESDLVDGRWMRVTESLSPDGWLLVVMTDVTPLKNDEATLRRSHDRAIIASLTDDLTQLPNRRHIFGRLDDLLATTGKMRIPMCVAIIDIDHFKRINDTHGHGTGDEVLRHFARHLRAELRPLDEVGRIGGEEFLLLLPNASIDSAGHVLGRLQSQLNGAAAKPAEDRIAVATIPYAFSAGVTLALDGDTPSSVFQRADRSLYVAKGRGRGRWVACRGESLNPG